MSRASDLRPQPTEPETLQPEPVAPPKPIVNKPPQITADHFREKLDGQQAKARSYLRTVCDILMTYPSYRLTYSDCQFLMATMYSLSVRHQLSPGQLKSLETLARKADKACDSKEKA